MHYRVSLGAALLLSSCSAPFSKTTSIRTSASPEETFACVKQQLGALGYRQTSLDAAEFRIAASKIDPKVRRSDTQFRRMLNKLEVEVAAEADGQTSLSARARTVAEYTTQRGPTEVEEKASTEARGDAQQLFDRCRS